MSRHEDTLSAVMWIPWWWKFPYNHWFRLFLLIIEVTIYIFEFVFCTHSLNGSKNAFGGIHTQNKCCRYIFICVLLGSGCRCAQGPFHRSLMSTSSKQKVNSYFMLTWKNTTRWSTIPDHNDRWAVMTLKNNTIDMLNIYVERHYKISIVCL